LENALGNIYIGDGEKRDITEMIIEPF